MTERATHRVALTPRITGRYLADYMAASERARRTILRACKYRPIARIVQHDVARRAVRDFLAAGGGDTGALRAEARRLRGMVADSDFARQMNDNNADYIDAYAEAHDPSQWPDAEALPWPEDFRVTLNGVVVNPEVRFALRRLTRTNKVRTGFVALRYAKDTPLAEATAQWQSSILFGCRAMVDEDGGSEPDRSLCITLDVVTGTPYAAPGDARSRFLNVRAACQTIAEQWPSIQPPPNAVL